MDIIQYNAMHKFVGVLDNPLVVCEKKLNYIYISVNEKLCALTVWEVGWAHG